MRKSWQDMAGTSCSGLTAGVTSPCSTGPERVLTRYKNKPEHLYRVHPQVKVTAVPTLIHWTKVRFGLGEADYGP